MRKFTVYCILLAVLPGEWVRAQDKPAEQVRFALRQATGYFRSISTNGGYVGIYSLDLKHRFGEALYEQARSHEIWVQPPGTPSVGQCFLRAYTITGAAMYQTAAREVARALAWGQSQAGGWNHRVDVSDLQAGSVKPKRKKGKCTFDDNISQGALTFLINMDKILDEQWLSEAIDLGLEFMLRSQFPNGAWPQWYPLIGGYHDYYTFNDNAINDCIALMLKAHVIYGKDRYLRCAKLGGDFIIASQMDPPQAGWAQQYSHDLKPAWARAFEPPSFCSAVTARNIKTLLDLYTYTKDGKYLTPIPPAIEWLNKSKIAPNQWSRLYELHTNKPIYGDRDHKIHYTLEEISAERRNGYSWQGEYGITNAISRYNQVIKLGPDAYRTRTSKSLTPAQRRKRARQLTPDIKNIIAQLDDKGRWVKNNMIYSSVFVGNFNILCNYLEVAE